MTIGERPCSKNSSIRLIATLAMFAATLFVTSTFAAAQVQEKVLHNFNGPDGALPWASLIFDAAGNLYGTTYQGDANAAGTVFELTHAAVSDVTDDGLGLDGRYYLLVYGHTRQVPSLSSVGVTVSIAIVLEAALILQATCCPPSAQTHRQGGV